MCTIDKTYFTVNGISDLTLCNAYLTNKVDVVCTVTFASSELNKKYKAEIKVKLPTGADFSFFTELKVVSTSKVSFMQSLVSPLPATGVYEIIWVVIYNETGQVICQSGPVNTN